MVVVDAMRDIREQAGRVARQALFDGLAGLLKKHTGRVKSINLFKDPDDDLWGGDCEVYRNIDDDVMSGVNDDVIDTCRSLLDQFMGFMEDAERDGDLDGLVITRKTPEIQLPLARLSAQEAAGAVTTAKASVRP